MIITKETIAHYLLGRGLLTFDSVVDGDLLVVEATSRNRNFKVIRTASPGYFVKQVKTFEPQAIETMRYETACYWLSNNDPDFEPLRALMPGFYDFDPARHALVIELLPEGGSLSDYHRHSPTITASSARSPSRSASSSGASSAPTSARWGADCAMARRRAPSRAACRGFCRSTS
jgi:hypothetical protein